MSLIAVKLVEIFARAGFVAGLTYALGLRQAGQFGLVVTLIGLFALFFGWERHLDIQRRIVGEPEPLFDRTIAAAIPFWGFNYAAMLPVFLILAGAMAKLDAAQLALAGVIVVSEHIANQVYQMALVNPRYRRLVPLVAAKNVGVLAVVLPDMLFAPSRLTLGFVLVTWATASALSTATIIAGWRRIRLRSPADAPREPLRARIVAQHRASFTHFRIGVIAFLMLQYDRLAVGTFAGLADAGIYFRHVLLIFFGYQLYTVASFNRITPAIFHAAKTEPVPALVRRLTREYRVLLALALAVATGGIALDLAMEHAISSRYHLDYALAAILLTGAMIRVAADFAGLIINARRQEAALGHAQLIAFACGAALLAALTSAFGIAGAAIANVVTALVYFLLVARAVRALIPVPESLN